jgi:hypothetical protein
MTPAQPAIMQNDLSECGESCQIKYNVLIPPASKYPADSRLRNILNCVIHSYTFEFISTFISVTC